MPVSIDCTMNTIRIIDAETNNISDHSGITEIEDVAHNAIAVYWNPQDKPAFLSGMLVLPQYTICTQYNTHIQDIII